MSNMLTIQQVADRLGVSTKTLRRWEENKYLVPDEKEKGTNVRLYHPYRIEYWKRMIELDRAIKKHLNRLDELKKELDKHMLEQDYRPDRPLKLSTEEDVKNFSKAHDAMDEWENNFRKFMNELSEYPNVMLKATLDKYDENEK